MPLNAPNSYWANVSPNDAFFFLNDIHFIHAEELRRLYPQLGPKEREDKIAAQYGAVFVRGIGGPLGDNTVHDGRARTTMTGARKQNPVYWP